MFTDSTLLRLVAKRGQQTGSKATMTIQSQGGIQESSLFEGP